MSWTTWNALLGLRDSRRFLYVFSLLQGAKFVMVSDMLSTGIIQRSNQLQTPDTNHAILFYSNESIMLEGLANYISTELQRDTTCLVLATPKHAAKLRTRLKKNDGGTPTHGRLHIRNATNIVANFLRDGYPDDALFMESMASLIQQYAGQGKQLQIFGEIMALLWQSGNEAVVMHAEEVWEKLAQRYRFSLYCMYPELHFVLDSDARTHLSHWHQQHMHIT